jgi:hypothetical protein
VASVFDTQKIRADHVTLIKAIIEQHGPLTLDATAYFLEQESKSYVTRHHVYDAIRYDRGEALHYNTSADDYYVRLASNHTENPRTPSFEERKYVEAYYKLRERFLIFKADPELAGLPEEWLDEIL